MRKETIAYEDYNGTHRVEDFWFNLSEAEVLEMQMSTEGGLDVMLQNIVKSKDMPSIIKIFKEIILKAYGEKSADGKRFEKKNGALAEAFSETPAYSKLYMKLATDDKAASDFINGIVPNSEKVREAIENGEVAKLTESKPTIE